MDMEITARGPIFEDRTLGARFDQEIMRTLSELGALGQRLVVDKTPRGISSGGGGLRGSIFTELRGSQATREQFVSSSLFYAPIVEVGRRPGQRPPPRRALELWVVRKLGVASREAPSVAFLVARAIGVRGTQEATMFRQAFERVEPIARRAFDALGARMASTAGGA